jgi:hypothetical protein
MVVGRHAVSSAAFSHANKKAQPDFHRTGLAGQNIGGIFIAPQGLAKQESPGSSPLNRGFRLSEFSLTISNDAGQNPSTPCPISRAGFETPNVAP